MLTDMLAEEAVEIPANKRLCQCGKCAELIDKVDKRGREHFYKNGHQSRNQSEETRLKRGLSHRGQKRSLETRHRISQALTGKKLPERSGEKHSQYKGDSVGYFQLHAYVNKYKPKPIDGLCEICHERPYHDLANMKGVYDRSFDSYKYLCVSCHRRYDYSRKKAKDKADSTLLVFVQSGNDTIQRP